MGCDYTVTLDTLILTVDNMKQLKPQNEPIREPRTPEELALALRTPALRAAIAKRKKQTKK